MLSCLRRRVELREGGSFLQGQEEAQVHGHQVRTDVGLPGTLGSHHQVRTDVGLPGTLGLKVTGRGRRGQQGRRGHIMESQAWHLKESGFKDLASSCVPHSSRPNAFLMADTKRTHASFKYKPLTI